MGLYYALAFFAFIIGRIAIICEVRSEDSLKVTTHNFPTTILAKLVEPADFFPIRGTDWLDSNSNVRCLVAALAL